MNVASLELCKELYELSGWDRHSNGRRIEKVWMRSYSTSEMGQGHPDFETTPESERNQVHVYEWNVTDNPRGRITTGQEVFKWWYSKVRELEEQSLPAYDLGYLLRKLHEPIGRLLFVPKSNNTWGLWADNMDAINAETPEDAAAKLAIELFKQGVLTKS